MQEEMDLLPYQENDTVHFVHSKGYSFYFVASKVCLEWEEVHPMCEWFCCDDEYYSFQMKLVEQMSDYPRLRVKMSVGGDYYGNYAPLQLIVIVNQAYAVLPYDSLVNFYCDSLTGIIRYDSLALNA